MKKVPIREVFNDAHIADTRQWMLEDGLRSLHRAFAECDTGNRARIIEHFPFIAQAAKFYGLHSEACNTFEHDDIVMPDDIDADIDTRVQTAIREIVDNM